jgi:hypothetical protein
MQQGGCASRTDYCIFTQRNLWGVGRQIGEAAPASRGNNIIGVVHALFPLPASVDNVEVELHAHGVVPSDMQNANQWMSSGLTGESFPKRCRDQSWPLGRYDTSNPLHISVELRSRTAVDRSVTVACVRPLARGTARNASRTAVGPKLSGY